MNRNIIDCPAAPEITTLIVNGEDQQFQESNTISYDIKVITPIAGGGVEAGKFDSEELIRVPSIRGQLRFWWRTTRGARCHSITELKQRESEVWGSTENPSPVSITVEAKKWTCRRLVINNFDFERYGSEAYVLFPFKPNNKSGGNDIVKEGLEFKLTLRWSSKHILQRYREQENLKRIKKNLEPLPPIQDIALDIESAIWAWVNFGGIGARTRRGCGAIYCESFAPSSLETIMDWYNDARQRYQLTKPSDSVTWPTINAAPLLNNKLQESIKAWGSVIEHFKNFRQGEQLGRNEGKGGKPLGRSRWPEADSLRKITGNSDPLHETSITLPPNDNQPGFPRAEFGLPINFQFIGNNQDNANKCELYPQGKSRMASPLILRPLAIGNAEQALEMMLPLNTQSLNQLEIKNLICDELPSLTSENIQRSEFACYTGSPMGKAGAGGKARSAKGSAMEAFLSYANTKGFKEIVS